MDIQDDYVLMYIQPQMKANVKIELLKLGDDWKRKPLLSAKTYSVDAIGIPKFFCKRCLDYVEDIYDHVQDHIEEDRKAGKILKEDDNPSLICPKCGKDMEFADEDIGDFLPLKCECGYKRTIKMYEKNYEYLVL